MLVEIIHFEVRHRGNTALRLGRVGLLNGSFANEGHLAFARGSHLEGVTHPGHTGTNYQEVEFTYHSSSLLRCREVTFFFSNDGKHVGYLYT